MRLRRKLAIRCAKLASSMIQKINMGSGAAFPGYIARMIDPEILPALADTVREKIIVTTGTNGKTTTNSILCCSLAAGGKKVVSNRTGANMLNGIISAFVLAADQKGCLDADYACIEADEMETVYILSQLKPGILLLTNIFRDQLDRYGEVDITCDKIKAALSSVPDTKLLYNSDDLLSYSLASECKNSTAAFGISERAFDDFSSEGAREGIFCHSCGAKIEYSVLHYGHLGVYQCPKCGLKRPEPAYTASGIRFSNGVYSFDIDGIHINSRARYPYNVYNTLSAYAALRTLNAPTDRFKQSIETFDYENNREGFFSINNCMVQLHLIKNQVGFQQKIDLMRKDPKPKDIIIRIDDKYQDGIDISWLWDVDFTCISDINAVTITTNGIRRYDMALRLKYEDIRCSLAADMRKAVEGLTQNGTGNLYVVVTYTGLHQTHEMLDKLQKLRKGGNTA